MQRYVVAKANVFRPTGLSSVAAIMPAVVRAPRVLSPRLGTFENFAGDMPTRPMLLAADCQGLAGPIERDFHIR
jgi:hypothetical protein